MNTYIEQSEKYLLHTYNRYPIVMESGEGVYIKDVEGKRYLDFVSGIGVYALGYNNMEFNNALKCQIDKLIHTSNYFYSEPLALASKALCEATGMDRVFFTNSGAEAIEGTIKVVRKYAFNKNNGKAHNIIALENSFHGRTLGALSITGNPKYREAFEPLVPEVRFAKINDIESIINNIDDNTIAIILEPIQGEGGVYVSDISYLEEIRRITIQRDILLIFDEIQCGMGRTGSMFAWQDYDVKPDIITVAKAIGSGFPIGAFLTSQRVADGSLVAGDHGSTYGGNPLGCTAVYKTLDLFKENHIIDNVKSVSAYLEVRLEELADSSNTIKEIRGKGLLRGIEFKEPVANIINRAHSKGLLLINAGTNVIRLIPPLVINNSHVDEMMVILQEVVNSK